MPGVVLIPLRIATKLSMTKSERILEKNQERKKFENLLLSVGVTWKLAMAILPTLAAWTVLVSR